MSLLIPPGYGNAAFIFDGTAGTPQFVTTIGVDLVADEATPLEAANAAFNAYADNLMPRTYSGLTLVKVALTVGSNGPTGSVDSDRPAVVGGLGGADAALSMSVIAQKRTTRLGRSGRGRMFLPGLLANEDVNPNGDMGDPVRAAIQEDVDGFLADLVTGGVAGKALGPMLFHTEGTANPAPDNIGQLAVQKKVGWVRKRIR